MKLMKAPTYEQRYEELSTWHQKFAWLPTVVGGHLIWLERYERRAKPESLADYGGMVFETRALAE